MKIDWKAKFTSRKFWAAIVGFITPLLLAFGVSDHVVTQVVSIVMSGAAVVAYIFGEAATDASRNETATKEITEPQNDLGRPDERE